MPRMTAFLERKDKKLQKELAKQPDALSKRQHHGKCGGPQHVSTMRECIKVEKQKPEQTFSQLDEQPKLPIYERYASTLTADTHRPEQKGGQGASKSHMLGRKQSMLSAMSINIRNPFRRSTSIGDSPRIGTPTTPIDKEDIQAPVRLGKVSVHTRRITNPVAPYMGFPAEAEVVGSPMEAQRGRRGNVKEGGRNVRKPPVPPRLEVPIVPPQGILKTRAAGSTLILKRQPINDYLKIDIPRGNMSVLHDLDKMCFAFK